MNFLVIGASGRIGTEIVKQFSEHSVICPNRGVYKFWHKANKLSEIRSYLDQNQVKAIFICSGVMDPKMNREEIFNVNYNLPKNIIEATEGSAIRIITFGTIMELVAPGLNQYVESKEKLQKYIDSSEHKDRILSLKIHTIYGGKEPNRFMFLGQVLEALKTNQEFKMTSGNQLREYHHVEDLVKAIKHLFAKKIKGTESISTGEPVKLKELAIFIFNHFGKISNLKIGEINENRRENFNTVIDDYSSFAAKTFRDQKNGVVSYLEKYMDQA